MSNSTTWVILSTMFYDDKSKQFEFRWKKSNSSKIKISSLKSPTFACD